MNPLSPNGAESFSPGLPSALLVKVLGNPGLSNKTHPTLKGVNQSADLPILAVTVGIDILGLQTGNTVTLQDVPEPSAVYLVIGG